MGDWLNGIYVLCRFSGEGGEGCRVSASYLPSGTGCERWAVNLVLTSWPVWPGWGVELVLTSLPNGMARGSF